MCESGSAEAGSGEPEDKLKKLCTRQKEILTYQYHMLFKTIMNHESYAKELKSKKE